jgi:outer membrane protein assembly factor BamB
VKHPVSPATGPRSWLLFLIGLALLASFACGRIAKPSGWASPALGDDLLLVAHEDELFALDAETLSPKWGFPGATGDDDIDPVALYGTPARGGDSVFVPAYDGKLYALDAESGQLLWQEPFETDGALVGGVAVSEDTVYFGSDDAKVYAVDVDTGIERWSFKTDDSIWSTPQLVGGILYVTSQDGKLYALDANAKGNKLWSFETDAGIVASPVVDEEAGLVYVGGIDAKLRAIDLETREERWSIKAGNWFWAEPHVSEGVVYAGSLDKKVYAVDSATGEQAWSDAFSAESPVRSTALVVNDDLLVFDRDGRVYQLDPATGERKTQAPLILSGDVLSDPVLVETAGEMHVVVVTTDGDLIRIDPATLTVVGQQKLG